MSVNTLEALFVQELSDMYSAEKQLTKAIPKLARAATNPELVAAFESHLQETHHQVERIDQVVETVGLKLKRIKYAAMEGLVGEGNEIIEEVEKGPVLDAALIAAAQKVEHYEIASYGTLLALARQLDFGNIEGLLQETLAEEKAADQKLTQLAEGGANQAAAQAESGSQARSDRKNNA